MLIIVRSFMKIFPNLSDEKEGAWEASRAPGTNVTLSRKDPEKERRKGDGGWS